MDELPERDRTLGRAEDGTWRRDRRGAKCLEESWNRVLTMQAEVDNITSEEEEVSVPHNKTSASSSGRGRASGISATKGDKMEPRRSVERISARRKSRRSDNGTSEEEEEQGQDESDSAGEEECGAKRKMKVGKGERDGRAESARGAKGGKGRRRAETPSEEESVGEMDRDQEGGQKEATSDHEVRSISFPISRLCSFSLLSGGTVSWETLGVVTASQPATLSSQRVEAVTTDVPAHRRKTSQRCLRYTTSRQASPSPEWRLLPERSKRSARAIQNAEAERRGLARRRRRRWKR
jgi:hypothetical protein